MTQPKQVLATGIVVEVTAPTKVTGPTVLFDFKDKTPIFALVSMSNAGATGGSLIGPGYVVYRGDVKTQIPVPGTGDIIIASIEANKLKAEYKAEYKGTAWAQVVAIVIYE
jgi:hypothetical protein